MLARLDVGSLAYATTQKGLQELSTQAGNVNSFVLINEPNTQHIKGFAYVKMNSHTRVQKAIRILNGHTFPGMDIATVSKMVEHASIPATAHYGRRSEEANKKPQELLHILYNPRKLRHNHV